MFKYCFFFLFADEKVIIIKLLYLGLVWIYFRKSIYLSPIHHNVSLPLPLLRESDYSVEFDYFLRGKESLRIDVKVPEVEGLTKDQVRNIIMTNVPVFA